METYKKPLYYEIAFSFVDPEKQIDFFEKLIKKYSQVEVKRFLDIACGPSLQLKEIARRGYKAVGLDISGEMIDHLDKEAEKEGLDIETVEADMVEFNLKKKADFALIMMGSFNFESNKNLLSHLQSAASSLKRGGLYFIQNLGLDWTAESREEWTMKRGEIEVTTTYEGSFTDKINQAYTEELILSVNDAGEEKRFAHKRDLKFVFPQEFKLLLEINGEFEFLGWWPAEKGTWNLSRSLKKAESINNNMVLLRKR